MAQTVVVTAGTALADSASISIAAGATYTFTLYASSGGVKQDMTAGVYVDSPGGDSQVAWLDIANPAVQIQGPVSVFIKKQASATACGVIQDA